MVTLRMWIAGMILLLSVQAVQGGTQVTEYRIPVFAWRAAWIEPGSSLRTILGAYDHQVVALDAEGQTVWTRPVSGVPLGIATGDVDGDTRVDVAVVAFNPAANLYLFSEEGTERWVHESAVPLISVVCADLDGDGKAEIIAGGADGIVRVFKGDGRMMEETPTFGGAAVAVAVGRLGQKTPEIVVGGARGGVGCITPGGTEWRWRFNPNPEVPELSQVGDIAVADLDGDGKDEILVESRPDCRLSAVSNEGSLLWRQDRLWETWGTAWSIARVEAGNFTADPGLETVVAGHDGVLYLFDAAGKRLYTQSLSFPVLDISASAGTVYLHPLRLRSMVGVQFSGTGGNMLADWNIPNPVQSALQRIRETVDRLPMPPPGQTGKAPHEPAWVMVQDMPANRDQWFSFLRTLENERQRFFLQVRPNMGVIPGFGGQTQTQRARGAVQSVQDVVAMAQQLDTAGMPFVLWTSHGTGPYINLEAARATLQATTGNFIGFYPHETGGYPSDEWFHYMEHFIGPLLELCSQYHRRVLMDQTVDWWRYVAADPRVCEILFKPEYKDVLVPMLKCNNAHNAETSIGAILGLKSAGLVTDWGISSHFDNWRWDFMELENLCPPDVILRMLVAAGANGARYYRIEKSGEYIQLPNKTDPVIRLRPWSRVSYDLFFNLLRKGVLPTGGQAVDFSPVVLGHAKDARHQQGRSLGLLSLWQNRGSGLFDIMYALQTTPETYAPRAMYGLGHFHDGMFPPTPYGMVRIVPEARSSRFDLLTDGIGFLRGSERLDGVTAITELRRQLEAGRQRLPFQADGVFLQVQQLDETAYLAFLIDPGFVDPQGVRADVRIQITGTFTIRDRITGENVPVTNSRFQVPVPAGGFRILEITRVKDSIMN